MKTTVKDLISSIHATYTDSPMPFNVHLILSHLYQTSGDSKNAKEHLEKAAGCCEDKRFNPVFDIERQYLSGYRNLEYNSVYYTLFSNHYFFPALPKQLVYQYMECLFNLPPGYWTNYAFFECAFNLFNLKDWESALTVYKKVINRSWRDFWESLSYLESARVYQENLLEIKKDRREGTINDSEFREYETILTDKILGLFMLYYEKFGKTDNLDQHLDRFSRMLEQEQYFDKLIQSYTKIDAMIHSHTLKQDFYYRMSKIFYRLERFSEGKEICTKLLTIYPDYRARKSIMLRLAALYEKEGLYKNAVKVYDEIIDRYSQQSISAHANRACLEIAKKFLKVKDFENAIEVARFIVDKRYDRFVSAEALYLLYTVYRMLRDRSKSDYDTSFFSRRIEETASELARSYPDSMYMELIQDADFEENPKKEQQRRMTMLWSAGGALLLVFIFSLFLPMPLILLPVFFLGFFGLMYFVYYIIIF